MFGRRRRARTRSGAPDPGAPTDGDAVGDDVASDTGVEAVPDLLDRRLAAVEQELSSLTAGASLCAISRSAGSVPTAKYLEGRMAAILEVRRGVQAGRPLSRTLDESTERWRAELRRTEERSMGAD